jgi:hypothetical protein
MAADLLVSERRRINESRDSHLAEVEAGQPSDGPSPVGPASSDLSVPPYGASCSFISTPVG